MIAYDGQVKILDFGVAKFDAGGAGAETRTGEVKGKMAYMSPEQALGDKLDCRSDLFGVGAVLFECLTGRRMWGTGTDVEVMRKLALEVPPRLDEALPSAPPALVDLHTRLVAREPAGRLASANEVAARLRLYVDSSTRSDAAALRDLMARLFPAQADMRRAQLTEALRHAAPSNVEALRRSLEPGAALQRPTLTEAVIVQRVDGGTDATPPVTRRRGLLPLWIAPFALALVAAVAAGAKRGSAPLATPTPVAVAADLIARSGSTST